MQPRVKFGLIVGVVGLALNACVGAFLGICGPGVSLIAGAAAGFFAAQAEKAITKGDGARLGAISGAIAGALVLIGQVIGAVVVLLYVQFTHTPMIFGQAPLPNGSSAQQIVYYATGIGTGLCFGLIGVILAALAGAGAGYLGTPDQPAPVQQMPTQ